MPKYSRLVNLLSEAHKILIIGHKNADPDAICSAYALSKLIRKVNPKTDIIFLSPDGVSKLSKQLLQIIPLKITEQFDPSEAELIVTVDTNTLQQLGELHESIIKSVKPLVMIDHHAPHRENQKTASYVICDETSTSTCEIILDMFQQLQIPLKRRISQALLIGLIVETGHFAIATKRTFKSASTLIQAGADPVAALRATKTFMDDSERIARVKAAQRMRLERIDRWLIGLSEIGSYHASAARALISLGAHLAVVAGKRNDELMVSFRSTPEFYYETDMHLGTELANPLGKKLSGMGGGHATAAGANGKGEARDALKMALNMIRDYLTKRSRESLTINNQPAPSFHSGISN